MSRMSENDVREALSPYHSRLRRVVTNAYNEWLDIARYRASKGYGPVLYSRTIANDVFDAIARHAKSEFASDKFVLIRNESQTVKFIFEGKVIVRFKKADEYGLGTNILTQAILDYIDPQQMLPGFPPEAAKVEVVWTANDIGTEIDAVTVVARDNLGVLWSYAIEDVATPENVTLLPERSEEEEFNPMVVARPKRSQTESE